jgi:radical SAM superfamily enzyme YgiQ (UPF0313 family)
MMIQNIQQGTNKIRIESATSLEDAKANNFIEGIYSRYFINDKPINSYMALIQHIVKEAQTTGNSLIPDHKELTKIREDLLKQQSDEMKAQFKKLKDHYKFQDDNIDFTEIDEYIKTLDEYGVRVKK